MPNSPEWNPLPDGLYLENDLTGEIKLNNGTEWLVFKRTNFTDSEAKLSVVRQLLEDAGINKQQIFMLLSSLDNQ